MAKSSLLPSSHHLSLFQNRTTTPPAHLLEDYFYPGPQTSKSDSSRLSSGLMFWMWAIMWPQWTLDRFEMIILSTSRSKDIREGCGKRKDPKVAFTFRSPRREYLSPEIDFSFRLRLRAARHHVLTFIICPKEFLMKLPLAMMIDDVWWSRSF